MLLKRTVGSDKTQYLPEATGHQSTSNELGSPRPDDPRSSCCLTILLDYSEAKW